MRAAKTKTKASKKQDTTLTPGDRSGVHFDDQGPVVHENLSVEERAAAGGRLGEKNIELRELEQDAKDSASKYRKEVKALKKVIAELSDEAYEGVRRVPAQKKLPGTEGPSA